MTNTEQKNTELHIPYDVVDKIMTMRLMIIIDEEFNDFKKIMIEDESYYALCDYHLRTLFENIKKKYYFSRYEAKFVGKVIKYFIYKEDLKGYVLDCFFDMGMTLNELPVELYNLDNDYNYFIRWADPSWIKNECKRWKPLWKKFKSLKEDLNNLFKLPDNEWLH